ncbi:MAG: hypothetical protein U0176_15720 [Bacteroidia bacterium]
MFTRVLSRYSALGLGLCILHCGLQAQTVLFTEGFETDGEAVRYTSNTFIDCTQSDFFIRTNTNPVQPSGCGSALFLNSFTNLQGSFFWASEDIRTSSPILNSRPPGAITTQSFNITGYTSLNVSLFLACSGNNGLRWESTDSLNIKASINGGAFRTVGRFMGKGDAVVGGHLGIDGNLNGVYDIGIDPAADVDNVNFTQYSFNIPGTGTTMRLQFDYDEAGGSEEMAIDQIRVTGNILVPVRWAGFTGRSVAGDVVLDWGTWEETNVSTFEVERWNDESGYSPIGTVSPKGSGSSYEFVDQQPNEGSNLYRIRQVDLDGSYTYSEVVAVEFSPSERILLHPNPCNGNCTVN